MTDRPLTRARKDVTQTSTKEVSAFIDAMKRSAPAGERGRLIFALDATASRRPTWDRACDVQAQMFLEADRLSGLDVQLAFYRGFGECRASRWVSDTKALVDLMTRVDCRAGRTQINRILRHAEKESRKQRVHALVFIGDACEEGLDELGHRAGELGLGGVRAFMFQEGADTNTSYAFSEIARLTGGAHCRFDASAPAELRDLLGAVAAFAAGGREALKRLSSGRSRQVKLLESQIR